MGKASSHRLSAFLLGNPVTLTYPYNSHITYLAAYKMHTMCKIMEDIIFMVGIIYLPHSILCALPKSILKQFLSSNGQVKKSDV